LLVVADGMGGHQGGNIASRAAVKAVEAELAPLLQRVQPIPTLRLSETGEADDDAAPAPAAPDAKRTVNLSRPTVNLSQATVHLDEQADNLGTVGTEAAGVEAAEVETALAQAVALSQDAVRAAAQEIGALDDAGTTLTIGLIAGLTLFCAQVGDSRAYLWRHSQLRQLTHDHSGAAALVAAGVISEEEARNHPVAHQLYRYLGGSAQAARADITKHQLAPGDRVLLCSDGLWDMLHDAEIAGQLLAAADLEDAAAKLIAAANAAGGEDNITVVLAQLAGEEV
jgi:protein phosphatase